MRATGIVRRIDELGRVVIPKEIRRIFRIRESDPLEIFTTREGEIILKKYSPIGEMGRFAAEYADSLAKVSGHVAIITDRDQIIAVSGGKKNLLNKELTKTMETFMEKRECVLRGNMDGKIINLTEEGMEDCVGEAICPIICEGDVIGAVVLVNTDDRKEMSELEKKLVQTAAVFLGRQMEQ